jgi:CHAT domain
MNSSITKTLIALLLAIKELKTPLSKDEQANLQDVGQQLELDPDYWDFIEEQITALIKSNYTLNQIFQSKIRKLEGLDGRIPREFLPNFAEFKKELFGETKEIVTFDGSSNGENRNRTTQIIDITSTILKTENQDQTTKQLVFLEQISEYVENYRYFNTYFTEPNNQTLIPQTEPLIHGQTYFLCINISPEPQGIDTTPFPDQTLNQVWNDQETLLLDVAVTSKDFHINATTKKLSLPRTGASDNLIFTVKPHKFDGRGYIQVELFYRGYLLQSKQLAILIIPTVGADIPESLRPPQSSRVTFTTTDLLTSEKLARLPERFLTIDVQVDMQDGTTDLRFLDRTQGNRELVSYETNLQSGLGSAIASVRKKLKAIASTKEGYQFKIQGDMPLLNTWLPQLADAGRRLYRLLLPENKSQTLGEDKGEKLRAALKPDSVIQINPINNPILGLRNTTIPWGLLYERKVIPSKQLQVCQQFQSHDIDCNSCPAKNDYNFVCPHAFWGYRYAIEQLPGWTNEESSYTPNLVWEINNTQPLHINFNVWRDFRFWKNHLPKLEKLGSVKMLVAEERIELQDIWATYSSDLDIIYFYCHGGIDEVENISYLQLSDEKIYSNTIDALEVNWQHRPLVLLNGCSTGDYSPESYMNLINDFRGAGASGVIGTECPVPEMFAEPYALALLTRVFRGEPLGKAMLAVRREMLQQNLNPLGLVYSLYAPYEIALARAVTHH